MLEGVFLSRSCWGPRRDANVYKSLFKFCLFFFKAGFYHLIPLSCGRWRSDGGGLSLRESGNFNILLKLSNASLREGLAGRKVEGPLGLSSWFWAASKLSFHLTFSFWACYKNLYTIEERGYLIFPFFTWRGFLADGRTAFSDVWGACFQNILTSILEMIGFWVQGPDIFQGNFQGACLRIAWRKSRPFKLVMNRF